MTPCEILINEIESLGIALDAEQKSAIGAKLEGVLAMSNDASFDGGYSEGYDEGLSDGQDNAETLTYYEDDMRLTFEAFKLGNNEEAMRIARQIAQDATGGILT